jgi:hypothetical protein
MQQIAEDAISSHQLTNPPKPFSSALRGCLKIAHFDAEALRCRDSQSNPKRNVGNSLRFLCVSPSKFVNFQTDSKKISPSGERSTERRYSGYNRVLAGAWQLEHLPYTSGSFNLDEPEVQVSNR